MQHIVIGALLSECRRVRLRALPRVLLQKFDVGKLGQRGCPDLGVTRHRGGTWPYVGKRRTPKRLFING